MMETVQNHSEADKVHAVNSFFNIHLRYAEDANNWKRDNFWATPFESMVKGQGDCEDFAIAKFKTLVLLGVPEDRLHLHYVNIVNPRSSVKTPHMIVVYQNEDGQHLVLDNIDGRILERDNRNDLVTLFAFNTTSLKIRNSVTEHSPTERIQQWRDAISRFDSQYPLCVS
jgi:predicted transglutaminase-like cysteine proteinase